MILMSTSPIGLSANSYLDQAIASALQNAGVNANTTSLTGAASSTQQDSSQLSTFAQLASTLQNLQESNPTEYSKVTAQIAVNLQNAAQTAQSQGNSTTANQLNQLAGDFTKASQTGQLPNLQDLAQAVGGSGGHRHHHHGSAASSGSTEVSSSDSTSASSSSSSSSSSQALSQYQTDTGDSATNAAAIILQTLSNAGVTT